MRVPLIFILLATGSQIARAQPAHTVRDTLACGNPRAVHALHNPNDPRRYDQRWINYVYADGRCTTLPAGSPVTRTADADDLAILAPAPPGTLPLYAQQADISVDAPLRAPEASGLPPAPSGPPAALWQLSRTSSGSVACQLDGQSSLGHITLSVSADRPGNLRLRLQKQGWRIPAASSLGISASFSDGTTLPLQGAGSGNTIDIDMPDTSTVKPWIHGFTAGTTGTISFAAGNEPPWQIDLRGTSPAITALATCIKDNDLQAPAPLGVATTQPFAAPQTPAMTTASSPTATPAPATSPAAPSIYGTADIPQLRRTYGTDLQRLMNSPAWNAPFAAEGYFAGFEKAPNLPTDLWMVSVMTDAPMRSQISCFYDHDDADLHTIRTLAHVTVSGTVAALLDDTLLLGANCKILAH